VRRLSRGSEVVTGVSPYIPCMSVVVAETRPQKSQSGKFTFSDSRGSMASMTAKEHISHEAGNEEAWVCICKNTPSDDGFCTCDAEGNEVEPDTRWTTGLYVCFGCGRMIDPKTLEVIGRNMRLAREIEERERVRSAELNAADKSGR